MKFHRYVSRFLQFGSLRLFIEYAQIGALWPVVRTSINCIIKRKSFEQIYPVILKKIEPYLIGRYAPVMEVSKRKVQRSQLEQKHTRIVWFCWLQGYEAAPPIVKACFNSLKQLTGYSLVVIDNSNWREYVELPDYIVKKWKKKQIPPALFSDLLRLELLIKYGGTWIDSTVLCTGFKEFESLSSSSGSTNSPSVQEFKKYLEADLFLFQYTKQGSIPVNISNWFISAYSNNEVLIVLRDMLYAYWKDYDCVLDYYIFHLFFAIISKEYPEQIAAMPYGQSQNSLVLLHHWDEKFEQKKWDKLTGKVCFHKLAFRVNEEVQNNKANYYNYILTEYGRI